MVLLTRKNVAFAFCLFAVGCVALYVLQRPALPRSVRIGFQASAPSHFPDANGKAAGAVVDLLNNAARRSRIELDWIYAPEGPEEALESGKVDLWPVMADLPERRVRLYITAPFQRMTYLLLAPDYANVAGPNDLVGKVVAFTDLSVERRWAHRLFPASKLLPEPSGNSAIRAVCAGFADAAIHAQSSVTGKSVSDCRNTLAPVRLPMPVVQFGIGAKKNNSAACAVADAFRAEIGTMARDGSVSPVDFRWGTSLGSETAALEDYRAMRRLTNLLAGSATLAAILVVFTLFQSWRLRFARRQAVAATELKSEFLANMSHEIRTPLNAIIGLAELILADQADPRSRKRTNVLIDSARALLSLVNDILDLSKLEAGRMRLETVDFDLRAVVESVTDLMALRAEEKGLEFLCWIEPEVATQVRGDPARLRQILLNLVGNAVKFTAQGEVSLRVCADAAPGCVRFEVRDTGIGVEDDRRSLVFEPFTQGDASTSRRFGGTGLGLSIVRHLTGMMDGRVAFDSVAGKGSCFWFTARLPVQAGASRPLPLSLPDCRVLIVDDNRASQDLLFRWLRLWGCHTRALETPDAVFEYLRLERMCDAILIDLEMPAIRGDRLAEEIRRNPEWRHIPLIIMTPLGNTQSQDYWCRLGFAARVTKPVKQGELGACLASIIGQGPPPPLVSPAELPTSQMSPERRARFQLLVVEDNLVNQEVATGMLAKLGYNAAVASDGLAALDALTTSDYDLVLMDCQMPRMDGYEATRLIRDPSTRVRNHAVPIIAMTAHAMTGAREKCIQAGMDDYLTKPVDVRLLDKTVESWLSGREPRLPEMAAPPTPAAEGALPVAAFDKEELLDRLMGDDQLAQKVVSSFLAAAPGQIAALARAVTDADAGTARFAAHAIKGAAANVGLPRLSECAKRAEQAGKAGNLAGLAALIPEIEQQLEQARVELLNFCRQLQ